MRRVEAFVASLELGAYLVGGAVRDELLGLEAKDADFLVPGLDMAALQAALAPHGRVEALEVAGRPVGVRLHPRLPELRQLVPAGIEFAPLRRERSTGPGRHDFEIVVDPDARIEDDLARRDFTVNAIARRVGETALVDPFDGRADLTAGILRTVGPQSFAEDPLRLVRGLRFVSQLGLTPDTATREQMRREAASVRLVSGERVGGGLAADGMGELSKLLLGTAPERALALARDTGVLAALIPAFTDAIGFALPQREFSLDEHILRVVQVSAGAGDPLRVRLAALLHDLGKPAAAQAGEGADHAELGARIAEETLRRLRYPNALRASVVALVRFHTLSLGSADAAAARRMLARHGAEPSLDLLALHAADLRGKSPAGPLDPDALAATLAFAALLRAEQAHPYRLADLAVDGGDLLALGYRPGPALGRTLAALLAEVVEQPQRNRRDWLLERARELLRA
jgi:putative nucleotidyltransferase with HDIG domain